MRLQTEKILKCFVKEVRNLMQVGTHENIVSFYGVAWDEQRFPSIVLAFVAGGELQSYIEEYTYDDNEPKGLVSPTLRAIAMGLIHGVQHMPSKDMIHRDLKPQNVLLERTNPNGPPIPKIADFGESRDEDTLLTMTYVGTKFYIAPEIFRGERYGKSADVFSLGVILNQIDTLNPPYQDAQYAVMMAREPGSFRPKLREDAPDQITSLLSACMLFDKSDEYGPEGDLSYGRPSIDSLLLQIKQLSEESVRRITERVKSRKIRRATLGDRMGCSGHEKKRVPSITAWKSSWNRIKARLMTGSNCCQKMPRIRY